MSARPALLDLGPDSAQNSPSLARPLRSPRVHVAGEAPPELSPLDAFALQSRLLARQLQESGKDGARVSRLPPLTVASPLIVQGRSDYFRSISQDPAAASDKPESHHIRVEYNGLALKSHLEDAFGPSQRPQSTHPRMSRVTQIHHEPLPDLGGAFGDMARGRHTTSTEDSTDYFGARQERSPSPLRGDAQSLFDARSIKSYAARDCPQPSSRRPKQGSYDEAGLAPPSGPNSHRSPGALPSTTGAVDIASGDVAASLSSLLCRQLSSASANIPFPSSTPAVASFQRSLSAASDPSAPGRAAFNFSRPISRAGTPSYMPTRQASSDSQPSFILADDAAHTPISMRSEAFPDQADDKNGSYIYSKFTLPRGKAVQRADEDEVQIRPQTAPQPAPPLSSSHGFPLPGAAPPSPPTRPSSSSARTAPDDATSKATPLPGEPGATDPVTLDRSAPTTRNIPPFSSSSSSSTPLNPLSDAPGAGPRSAEHQAPLPNDNSRGQAPMPANAKAPTTTLRPSPSTRSNGPLASGMTAEEHLSKGIECHEKGSLNESTYHLRHAAHMDHPTAMLLYALACRHGWGMRPNQREGVEWLRKAAELAKTEMSDGREQNQEAKRSNIVEDKTRKAQLALSIYELGVSHMNGWGIEQDKTLALRCFEIAGNWGDVDALAETGFCYAQGIGCKKNLKKSAKYYRMAEAKGMSMVGNSWIHKAKYRDDGEEEDTKKDKKGPNKSRSRSMFGKKTAS